MEKLLGIHRDKLLPDFASATFESWAERSGRVQKDARGVEAVERHVPRQRIEVDVRRRRRFAGEGEEGADHMILNAGGLEAHDLTLGRWPRS
mgnify:CR=1 FL=1